jgi:hypothetical protein
MEVFLVFRYPGLQYLYFSSLPVSLALPFFQIFIASTIYHKKHNFFGLGLSVDITWFPVCTSVFTSSAVPCDLSVKWRKASSLRSFLPVIATLTLCAPPVTCRECYRTSRHVWYNPVSFRTSAFTSLFFFPSSSCCCVFLISYWFIQ